MIAGLDGGLRAAALFTTRAGEPVSLARSSLRVLAQVHPGLHLRVQARKLVDALLAAAFNAFLEHAVATSRGTILASHMMEALDSLLINELAKHATMEAKKALAKLKDGLDLRRPRPAVAVSAVVGLVFPVRRCGGFMARFAGVQRVSVGAAVCLTAALEYLAAEVLELSGNVAETAQRKSINALHVFQAVRADQELHAFFGAALDEVAKGLHCTGVWSHVCQCRACRAVRWRLR